MTAFGMHNNFDGNIPFEAIRDAALANADRLLGSWFPHGKTIGVEFCIGNIHGDPGESLKVNLRSGAWKDFAEPATKGGDLIGLYACLKHSGDRVAAARELGQMLGIMMNGHAHRATGGKSKAKAKAVWIPIPPPADAGTPDEMLRIYGTVYEYTGLDGRATHYVGRTEAHGDVGKIFTPITYGTLDGIAGWHKRAPAAPRPLYGLWRLSLMEGATVLVCEGERAADAATKLFPRHVCMSWFGGCGQVDYADFTPLLNRDVIIWPDNDAEGAKAAQTVLRKLPTSRMVRVDDLPEKADAADVTPQDAEAWLAARTIVPPPPPEPDAKKSRDPQSDEEEIDWPIPLDFLADHYATAPQLRPEHVPEALWPFVEDASERMGVDPTSVALAALVACASVMPDEWCIQPKRNDYTWTENPRLWGAIVGDPSILKTPVIAAATKPIDIMDAKARQEHQQAMRAYKEAVAAWKQAKDGTSEPNHPKLSRYLVEGSTIEAISEVLRDDDEARQIAPAGKVLSRHDEMSEFFGNLDRYKAGGTGGGDRGAYLRLWNGGRYTIDRIGRGSFAISNWSACFVGGIQPGPIQKIARSAAEDGLLQRFLYAVPGPQGPGQDRVPDGKAIGRYNALFPLMASLHPPRSQSGSVAHAILHGGAHQHREDIDAAARGLAALPDTPPRLKAVFGKWPGQFARLCLTFHLIELADARARNVTGPPLEVVTEATVQRVAGFMLDIILPHILRTHAVMFTTDQTGHAEWISGHILAHGMQRIASRDVVRAYGALRAPEAKDELAATMASLVTIGWLEPELPTNRAKPVSAWLVNPAVHDLFATRAEQEREARKKAQADIAADIEALRRGRKAA